MNIIKAKNTVYYWTCHSWWHSRHFQSLLAFINDCIEILKSGRSRQNIIPAPTQTTKATTVAIWIVDPAPSEKIHKPMLSTTSKSRTKRAGIKITKLFGTTGFATVLPLLIGMILGLWHFGQRYCISTPRVFLHCDCMTLYNEIAGNKKATDISGFFESGVPTGIRTPVTAVKGRCPRPLDDGDLWGWHKRWND